MKAVFTEVSANVLKGNLYDYLFRSSPKVPYVDETALERESNELSEESKELLAIYHKTFDDDRVRQGLVNAPVIIQRMLFPKS